MSRYHVVLRIVGHLNDTDAIVRAIGLPARVTRRGVLNLLNEIQTTDVILFTLAQWADHGGAEEDQAEAEQLLAATGVLERVAPFLVSLEPVTTTAEVSISTIRTEEQGGLELPAHFIKAAAAAGLSVGVSLLVLLDDDPDLSPPDET